MCCLSCLGRADGAARLLGASAHTIIAAIAGFCLCCVVLWPMLQQHDTSKHDLWVSWVNSAQWLRPLPVCFVCVLFVWARLLAGPVCHECAMPCAMPSQLPGPRTTPCHLYGPQDENGPASSAVGWDDGAWVQVCGCFCCWWCHLLTGSDAAMFPRRVVLVGLNRPFR